MGIFNKTANGNVSAVILCAGSSTRFGSNKQMAEICGKSVAERCIESFSNCDDVKEIILVVRKEDVESYKELVTYRNYKKVSGIVTGGATRQSSALRGVRHVGEKAKYVAIHDGARCLITPKDISLVIEEAKKNRFACAGAKVVDTIKIADENGFISKTINRDYVWKAQTPQIFDKEIYDSCAIQAKEDGFCATDDCMLMEKYGYSVKLVDVGEYNVKITFPEDIEKAEFFLNHIENGEKK